MHKIVNMMQTTTISTLWWCFFIMKRILISVLIPFLALLTVQICLKNPHTREMFTSIETYENIDTSAKAVTYSKIHFEKSENIPLELYFNGEHIEDFNEKTLTVNVLCDGIFEIKNSSNRSVTVTAFSNDSSIKIINKKFNRGISAFCFVDGF